MQFLSQFPRLLLHFLRTSPLLLCLYALPGLAQPITPDGSTPTNITQTGQQIDISGGTIAGPNQFHSFDQFNVPSEHTANFQAPAPVDNVLGRVTGGSPSAIEGTVRVSGSDANLYLMNPAGIVFGKDARLDVPGSFNATSANGIGFEGGGEFSAEGQNNYHDLATSPNSFNFKGNNGDIVNHGDLAVPAGETLNLVGGTVENTGRLSAPGGGVNIIAVPGRETVRIRQNGMVLELEVTDNGQGLAATDLPERLTGGEGHANTLEVSEDGSVRLTRQPRGTVTVRGTGEKPARIEGDRIHLQGQAVMIEDAAIDSTGVINQVILQSSQGSTAIVNSQINLSNLAGIGGLLELAGQSVQVNQSQVNLRGSQKGQIRVEATSGNTEINHSQITIATPVLSHDQVSPLSAELNPELGDLVLAGQLDILSPAQVVIARSDLAAYGVRIGGDFQGKGEFVTAQDVFVDADSAIAAGNAWGTPLDTSGLPTNPQNPSDPVAMAGRVIVWADDKTRFLGYLHNPAGFAEISGKRELDLGIYLDAALESTGTGNIILNGTGGQSSAQGYGVWVDTAGSVTATGSGTITIAGTGGSGNNTLSGILVSGDIEASTGNITLTGTGGTGTRENNWGIGVTGGATIASTSTALDAGAITLIGQGGSGTADNVGIQVSGGSQINTVNGNVRLTGTGGTASGETNMGIQMQASLINATGTATVTLDGIGGTGTQFNHGVNIRNVNDAANPPTGVRSAQGNVTITGTGGEGNNSRGIQLGAASEVLTTGTASIVLTGTAQGDNTDILTFGAAEIGGTSANNVSLFADVLNLSNGTTLQGLGTLTIAPSTPGIDFAVDFSVAPDSFAGITLGRLDTNVTTVSGDTNLSASTTILGGAIDFSGSITSNDNDVTFQAGRNMVLNPGSSINTGAGDINLSANQGATPAIGSVAGIDLNGASLATTTGNIELTGRGGVGALNRLAGVLLQNNSQISTQTGTIDLTGTGGDGSATGTSANWGVALLTGSSITSSGTGATITLQGTGGTGANDQVGVLLRDTNTSITSSEGDITLDGIAGSSTTAGANFGVAVQSGAVIESTGTGANAATITLTGTGGTVTSLIYGVILADAGSTITAIDGDITITGIGGDALVGNGHGIVLRGATIESTGTDANAAQITLQGTGGNGPGNNFRGIVLVENTQITSISGDINLEGTGGSGDANNAGVQVSGSTIRSTGTGATVADITITGTAGSGTDPQTGLIVAADSAITTVGGNITALGQSNGTDPIAQGINLNASEISSSGSGLIRLTVTDPTTGDAFAALGDAILGNSTGTGDITVTADTIALDSALIQGSGILTLQPNTPTTAIGIGDNVPGVFNLTATELNTITPTFSSINVGRSDGTGSIRVGININPAVASLVTLLGGSDLGGGDNDNLWTVTGVNTGTINGINFQNFTTLLGGGLTDTVQGSTADEDFLIANPDEVQVGNLTFTRVETLDGRGGNDRFTLAG